MLDTLSYNVRFPTGRAFDRKITFQAGQTAIIGANEQGKSLTLEMIRFCLFGSAALRGTADDYAHLQAELSFRVHATTYTVTRSLKNATLSDTDVMARGTKPVNARIIAILGFDLEVFDVACAANQGDVERLANMKPTARREMVDRLIGADRIEEIVDWTAEEALGLKREIEVLQRQLVEPVEPVKPEGWQDPDVLKAAIAEQQERRDEAAGLRHWLASKPPAVVVPEKPHTIERKTLDQAEELLGRVPFDFDIGQETISWALYRAWMERHQFETAVARPMPGVTVAICDAEIELERLNQELARLRKSPKLCCPNCDHSFTLADGEMTDVIAQIEVQESIRGTPIAGVTRWGAERAKAVHWEDPGVLAAWGRIKDIPEAPRPEVTEAQIEDAKTRGIAKTVLEGALEGARLAGATLGAVRVLRRQIDQWEAQVEAAGPAQERLTAWEVEEPAKRQRLAVVEGLYADLDQNRDLLQKINIYSTLQLLYAEQIEQYKNRVAEVDEKIAERASWLMGKEQLNSIRLKLKSFLAPSLSQVASGLLSQMTRGARRSIWVTDAFEIEVDGQKLQTLSGSGKVCANLALRIGLAQVLTNNVLSVFIGDEMDAFMDMERVEALNDCLERLGGRVGQIIVITHKPPMFKNVIDLGGGK